MWKTTRTRSFFKLWSTFACSFRRIFKRMWAMAVRHGFGAVRVDDDDDDVMHIIPCEEGTEEADANMSDEDDSTSLLFRDDNDGGGSHRTKQHCSSGSSTNRIWADAVDVLAPADSPHAPIDKVVGDPDYFAQSPDSDTSPSPINCPSDESKDSDMMASREVQQPHHGEPFLTLTAEQDAAMAAMVAPVHNELLRLKELTPDSMPKYHADLKMMSYAHILKTRLAIIERLDLGKDLSDGLDGRMELELCRYIATQYWPLPVTPTTHLDIHRIYRNSLFRKLSSEQLHQDRTKHQGWVNEALETQRPAMSFGEAACHLAAAQRTNKQIIDATMAENIQKRRMQEKEDRRKAEELDREINQGKLGFDVSKYMSSVRNKDEDAKVAAAGILKGLGQSAATGQGANANTLPPFRTDEEYARWLQDKENGAHNDMPGLIYGHPKKLTYEHPYVTSAREREQIARDRELALKLDNPPIRNLPRTRSQAVIARPGGREVQEVAESEDERSVKLNDVETPPPVASSGYYLLPPLAIAPRGLEDGDILEVGEREEDEQAALMQDSPTSRCEQLEDGEHTALMQDSPSSRYGDLKRRRRRSRC
ncbi:hypothetical protein DE146DRAFT_389468 [Phaeosphaeria sp. MPI-PUGE-AT-0046c]|nr:hypothetical protein DE146DRAFT_389468 [Phaeosphaeria sp. MPI-PUGE-AT-0046c]